MYDLPGYVWALVLAAAVGIPLATCIVLYRGAVAAGLGHRAATGVAAAAAAVLGGWLVITGYLARAMAYYGRDGGLWFGVAFAGLRAPHDGTVSVEETILPGITDHRTVATSHTGLLFSHEVADLTAGFLRAGRFAPISRDVHSRVR